MKSSLFAFESAEKQQRAIHLVGSRGKQSILFCTTFAQENITSNYLLCWTQIQKDTR